MKKVIRLTESDLARIVRRVINEQTDEYGRNNPSWVNLVKKLKTLSYPPKILTYNSYSTPPIPSQSLNWGNAAVGYRSGKYAFAIATTEPELPKEFIKLFNSEDSENETDMYNWWKKRGYTTNQRGNEILISFKDADKLKTDIESFFKLYPPQ